MASSVETSHVFLMDFLNVDETAVDERLQGLMTRTSFTTEHLQRAALLLEYKLLLNSYEHSDSDYQAEVNFAIKLLGLADDTTIEYTCKIVKFALLLDKQVVEFKAQHILQQVLCDLDFTSVAKVNEIDKSKLLYKLKMFDSVLEAVISSNIKLIMFNEIPMENLLYSDDADVRSHFVTSTVVKLIAAVQGLNILDRIWNSVSKCDIIYESKALVAMSALAEYYLPVANESGVVHFKSTIVSKQHFWIKILKGLKSQDSYNRKFSLYLAKRAIDCLSKNKRDITIEMPEQSANLLVWKCTEAASLEESWKCFFLLLETLEEKQGNIVRAALSLFQQISQIGNYWCNCAFELAFQHNNLAVVHKCIEYKLHSAINSVDDAQILLQTLNNINMFDNSAQSRHTMVLLKECCADSSQFKYIIKALVKVKWLPVPLFHLTEIFGVIKLNELIWSDLDKDELTNILSNIVHHPCNNLVIGKAVQCNVVHFTIRNSNSIGTANLFKIIKNVRCDFHLSSNVSLDISKNMEKMECKEDIWKLTSQCWAIDVPLMYLRSHPDEINNYLFSLEEIFCRLKDVNSRLYASKEQSDTDLIYICNLIQKLVLYENTFDCVSDITNFIMKNIDCALSYLLNQSTISDNIEPEKLSSYFEQCRAIFSVCSVQQINEMLSKYSYNILEDLPVLEIFGSSFSLAASSNKDVILQTYICKKLSEILQQLKVSGRGDDSQGEVKLGKLRNQLNEASCKLAFSVIVTDKNHFILNNRLILFLQDMLDTGGEGCLLWVLKIHRVILPQISKDNNDVDFCLPRFLERAWKEVGDLRSNAQCRPNMKEFIAIILHDCLLKQSRYNELILGYCTKILDYGSVSNVPLYFMTDELYRKKKISFYAPMEKILSEVLLFGRGSCKDRRITDSTVGYIKSDPELFFGVDFSKCDYYFDSEIRNKAIKILLQNSSPMFVESLVAAILQKILAVFHNKSRYHGNSQPHRLLLRSLQHVLFMSVICPEGVDLDGTVMKYILLLEKLPHQPSVRIFMEIFIAYYIIVQKHILNTDTILTLNLKTIPLPSLFSIMYLVMKEKLKRDVALIIDEYSFVMDFLLSHSMGQVFNVRLNAQYYAYRLYKMAEGKSKEVTTKYQQIFKVIEGTFKESKTEKNLIRLQDCYFANKFDVVENLTPKCIYFFIPKYTQVEFDEIMELDEIPSIDQCIDNITESSKINIDLCQVWLKSNKSEPLLDEGKTPYAPEEKEELLVHDISTIQKKYIPWSNMFHGEEACMINAHKKVKDSGLIVVASLIDKLPNLGGLARTSEVFGIKKYVINNLQHIDDKQFQGLSVSAEKWVEMEQVRAGQQLREYLQRMKHEGYTLVAAEQTSSSVSLDGFQFPHNTVLLLGHEKEGVPCDLLPLMDHCVEIPQRGYVRSLNVHVTAAIFIWEYVRQNLL